MTALLKLDFGGKTFRFRLSPSLEEFSATLALKFKVTLPRDYDLSWTDPDGDQVLLQTEADWRLWTDATCNVPRRLTLQSSRPLSTCNPPLVTFGYLLRYVQGVHNVLLELRSWTPCFSYHSEGTPASDHPDPHAILSERTTPKTFVFEEPEETESICNGLLEKIVLLTLRRQFGNALRDTLELANRPGSFGPSRSGCPSGHNQSGESIQSNTGTSCTVSQLWHVSGRASDGHSSGTGTPVKISNISIQEPEMSPQIKSSSFLSRLSLRNSFEHSSSREEREADSSRCHWLQERLRMELVSAVTEVNGINNHCELVLRVRRLGAKKWPRSLLYLESVESFLPTKVRVPLAGAVEEGGVLTLNLPLGITPQELAACPNPLIKLKVIGSDTARDLIFQSNAILVAVGARERGADGSDSPS